MKKSVALSIRLPRELKEKLDHYAEEHGKSLTAIYIEACSLYLDSDNLTTNPTVEKWTKQHRREANPRQYEFLV